METPVKKIALTLLLTVGASLSALAQVTPVGLWKTIDDDGKTEQSRVRISDGGGGKLTGKVEKITNPARQDAKCDKCTDARKDQPVLGMTLFSGLVKDPGEEDIWNGARILDPDKGEEYRMRVKMIDGGSKLQLRGYLGPFYRTQVWQRVE
jgi:uncharacterized protein (DUF2147 family)